VNDTAKVKAALLAAGLDEAEIQTSSYYINSVYNTSYYYCSNYKYYDYTDYVGVDDAIEVGEISSSPVYNEDIYYPYPDKSRCKIIGYKTTHVLLIKTNRTDYGEKIINAALSAVNTTQIDYIYFSLGETARINAESELQTSAAVSARTKAESIANGLGAKLGKIVSVNPDSYYPFYPTYAYNRAADSKDSSVPSQISPTDTTLSNSITVVYELRQS
jgi:uncharacterized protein YggE